MLQRNKSCCGFYFSFTSRGCLKAPAFSPLPRFFFFFFVQLEKKNKKQKQAVQTNFKFHMQPVSMPGPFQLASYFLTNRISELGKEITGTFSATWRHLFVAFRVFGMLSRPSPACLNFSFPFLLYFISTDLLGVCLLSFSTLSGLRLLPVSSPLARIFLWSLGKH